MATTIHQSELIRSALQALRPGQRVFTGNSEGNIFIISLRADRTLNQLEKYFKASEHPISRSIPSVIYGYKVCFGLYQRIQELRGEINKSQMKLTYQNAVDRDMQDNDPEFSIDSGLSNVPAFGQSSSARKRLSPISEGSEFDIRLSPSDEFPDSDEERDRLMESKYNDVTEYKVSLSTEEPLTIVTNDENILETRNYYIKSPKQIESDSAFLQSELTLFCKNDDQLKTDREIALQLARDEYSISRGTVEGVTDEEVIKAQEEEINYYNDLKNHKRMK